MHCVSSIVSPGLSPYNYLGGWYEVSILCIRSMRLRNVKSFAFNTWARIKMPKFVVDSKHVLFHSHCTSSNIYREIEPVHLWTTSSRNRKPGVWPHLECFIWGAPLVWGPNLRVPQNRHQYRLGSSNPLLQCLRKTCFTLRSDFLNLRGTLCWVSGQLLSPSDLTSACARGLAKKHHCPHHC